MFRPCRLLESGSNVSGEANAHARIVYPVPPRRARANNNVMSTRLARGTRYVRTYVRTVRGTAVRYDENELATHVIEAQYNQELMN